MRAKINTSFIVLLISLLVTSHTLGAGTYSGGTGQADSPYQIGSVADITEISLNPSDWDKQFILIDDINLTGNSYSTAVIAPDTDNTNSNSDFDGTTFSGTFDGNNHKISNLTIDTQGIDNDFLGLFGKTDPGSVIKNLHIQTCNIIAGPSSARIGGLIGDNYSTVTNCQVTGSINGSIYTGGLAGVSHDSEILFCNTDVNIVTTGGGSTIGGLIAYNVQCTITNCYAIGDINVGNNSGSIGGLVGRNEGGDLSCCYASGNVTSGDNSVWYKYAVGGLVGLSEWWGDITKCYASGDVTGGEGVMHYGGLCGANVGATISNSFATGDINAGADSNSLGGLVGGHYNNGSIDKSYAAGIVFLNDVVGDVGGFCGYGDDPFSNNFWDKETSQTNDGVGSVEPDPAGVEGLTTIQMQTEPNFINAGWDFVDETDNGNEDIWQIYQEGSYYPWFTWQYEIASDRGDQITLSLPENTQGQTSVNIYKIMNDYFVTEVNWTIQGYDTCSWITSVTPTTGSSTGPQDSNEVTINIDTTNLAVGDHFCSLTILNNDCNVLSKDVEVKLSVYDIVDFEEYARLASYFGQTGCDPPVECSEVDWYIDQTIDLLDLMQLAKSWLAQEIETYLVFREFFEDFSGTLPTEQWDYYSSDAYGRIFINGQRLQMDRNPSGSYTLNEAILHIDLSNQSNVMLSFFQREWEDVAEAHGIPATFSGHANGDGVSVSNDGINWHRIVDALDLNVGSFGSTFTINLDLVGLEYTSDFQIKFQQYDNYPVTSDGRQFDDIRVYLAE